MVYKYLTTVSIIVYNFCDTSDNQKYFSNFLIKIKIESIRSNQRKLLINLSSVYKQHNYLFK